MIKSKDAIPPAWSADIIAEMHINKISIKTLAQKLNCTREYLSRLLNGVENASNKKIEEIKTAINELIKERKSKEE